VNRAASADERRKLLRAVGPLGWVILEELSLCASAPVDGVCTLTTNVHQLTDAIGVGRDAVTHALARLRAARVLTIESERDTSGRFVTSRYVFTPIADVAKQPSPPSAAKSSTRAQPVVGFSADGVAVNGEHGHGEASTPHSRQQRGTATARTAPPHDNQLSLLSPDPA
jgi:DNA-binding transcriptional ArsR family regulator